MEHFYNNIKGWFGFQNLYRSEVLKASNNAHFVEVGTFLGCSAAYMAVEILNSNKDIKFDCVDTWKGSEEHIGMNDINLDTLYEDFLNNIKPVKNIIKPVRMESVIASKLYNDNFLDFVFIDASHDYESVKKDIYAWLPKVKSGGTLAGHDYLYWGGVTDAVNDFIVESGYELCLKGEEGCWSIIKK